MNPGTPLQPDPELVAAAHLAIAVTQTIHEMTKDPVTAAKVATMAAAMLCRKAGYDERATVNLAGFYHRVSARLEYEGGGQA